MIKICLNIILASAIIGCTSQPVGETKGGNDTINNIQVAGPGCVELGKQIDSLNHELLILKKGLKKNNSEAVTHKKKTVSTESVETTAKTNTNTNTPVVASKPAINDKDRNASVRCSFKDKTSQCKKRTFSPNGLCWQHGGN